MYVVYTWLTASISMFQIAFNSLLLFVVVFFFQAEDGIRELVRSRGLGDVYKRQNHNYVQRQPKFASNCIYYAERK